MLSVTFGPILDIPRAGNSLQTNVKLEEAPDFGFEIDIAFKYQMNNLVLSVPTLKFDSGEKEVSFTITSTEVVTDENRIYKTG